MLGQGLGESMKDMDAAINGVIQDLVKGGKASAGDAVVVITGTIAQIGATNLMRVQYA
jgi:pyruvate kinase